MTKHAAHLANACNHANLLWLGLPRYTGQAPAQLCEALVALALVAGHARSNQVGPGIDTA
jgi:hypothetical protein